MAVSAAANHIRNRLFDLVRRAEDDAVAAERATVDVVADPTRRPGSYAVVINGADGLIAMRGPKDRCDHHAATLRRDPMLILACLRQSRGWKR